MVYLIAIVLAVLFTTIETKVAVDLYNWFIPTAFHGMPNLTFIQMLGVGLAITMIFPRALLPTDKNMSSEDALLKAANHFLLIPGIIYLVGMVVHFYQ